MTLIPIQVTFRGLPHSDALEAEIREHLAWLEQFYAGIVRGRVVVELPHRHRRDGRRFHVRVELTVPRDAPIVVNREPSLHSRLKDVEEKVDQFAENSAFLKEKLGVPFLQMHNNFDPKDFERVESFIDYWKQFDRPIAM